jgi:hypothetical protein
LNSLEQTLAPRLLYSGAMGIELPATGKRSVDTHTRAQQGDLDTQATKRAGEIAAEQEATKAEATRIAQRNGWLAKFVPQKNLNVSAAKRTSRPAKTVPVEHIEGARRPKTWTPHPDRVRTRRVRSTASR